MQPELLLLVHDAGGCVCPRQRGVCSWELVDPTGVLIAVRKSASHATEELVSVKREREGMREVGVEVPDARVRVIEE